VEHICFQTGLLIAFGPPLISRQCFPQPEGKQSKSLEPVLTSIPRSGSVEEPSISPGLTLLLASACGLIAANLYYAQPLIGPISASLGMSVETAGMIVMATQLGYGAGLLLIVPLADLFENRTLIVTMVLLVAASLILAVLVPSAALFMVSALAIGLCSVAVQILVPYAAHMAPAAKRGQVVGNVMSGLMFGIMLARPVSSFLTELMSWQAVYYLSSAVMVLLALTLRRVLPQRIPHPKPRYRDLLASMHRLVLTQPILRRRALYQAAMFGVFSLFWTTVPLYLSGPAFRLSHGEIALFALAGAAGAVAAPIAGRIADKGWSRPATAFAMLLASVSFPMVFLAPEGSSWALGLLVLGAVLIDFGVSANVIIGQRAIFTLGADIRARLNGLYMATFFFGGAFGSAVGAWAYAEAGWSAVVWGGAIAPLLALAYFATEHPDLMREAAQEAA
tara:strand:- start:104 stop:1450 length:1347 start_codon:yes stop_codon:yes gene_type:complete